jgi:hypothetical protein
VFKLCNTVALVLSLSLTICAVFSVWSFTKHDATDRGVVHTQLVPAYQYYDSNRDAQAILNVRPHTMTIKGSIAGETQPCAFADATANTAWNTAFGSAVPAGSSWPWS